MRGLELGSVTWDGKKFLLKNWGIRPEGAVQSWHEFNSNVGSSVKVNMMTGEENRGVSGSCGYMNLHDSVDHRGEVEQQGKLLIIVYDQVYKVKMLSKLGIMVEGQVIKDVVDLEIKIHAGGEDPVRSDEGGEDMDKLVVNRDVGEEVMD